MQDSPADLQLQQGESEGKNASICFTPFSAAPSDRRMEFAQCAYSVSNVEPLRTALAALEENKPLDEAISDASILITYSNRDRSIDARVEARNRTPLSETKPRHRARGECSIRRSGHPQARHEKSSKHRKAEELIKKGQRIRILGESDFNSIIGKQE